MKKKLFIMIVCCAAMCSLALAFGGIGVAGIAYAAETEEIAPLVVGGAYTFSDGGGVYTVTIASDTTYTMDAVSADESETINYSGSYTYIDGKLTLYIFDDMLGVFTVDGTTLTEIVESDISGGEAPADTKTPTFTDRMNDWFRDNLSEFLSGLSVALSGIFMSVILPYLRKKMTSVNTTVLTNSSSQEAVVNVVNQLINKYNEVEKQLTALEDREMSRETRQEQFGICIKAVLEILTTVYNNSKNIPQATKDLVNLQYVKVLKSESESTEVLKDNGGE